jgi:hypothetical protein
MDQADAERVETVVDGLREDPEYAAAKTDSDEKYKEQAFGGCLGVVVIGIVTLLVSVAIIYTGMHRKIPQPPKTAQVSFDAPATVVPRALAGEKQTRLVVTQRSANISFTTVRATYGAGLDVFAAPASLPPPQREAFRLLANMAPDLASKGVKHDEVLAHGADYIVCSQSVEQLQRAINELAQ